MSFRSYVKARTWAVTKRITDTTSTYLHWLHTALAPVHVMFQVTTSSFTKDQIRLKCGKAKQHADANAKP